jgi:pimeloyl-ACP methyl ester carboxylesterase
MRLFDNNNISLATETFGDPDNPSILLIMGATASMLGWPDEFCATLAKRGHHVIRFDHRDTGRSFTVPLGEATYSVEDLAEDTLSVLDAHGVEKADIVGMSLGGYIGQMLAVTCPERVASLTLISSEPLGRDGADLPHISQAFLDHFERLGTLDWSNQKAVVNFLVESERLCSGSRIPFDVGRARANVEKVVSRTDCLPSMFNHGAVGTRDDWTGRFREISVPVLVIHGSEDPILPVENGRALAEGIRGASIHVLDHIGHELPLPILPDLAERIARHAAKKRFSTSANVGFVPRSGHTDAPVPTTAPVIGRRSSWLQRSATLNPVCAILPLA